MSVSIWQGIGGFVVDGGNFAGNHAPWASLDNFDWIAVHERDPQLELEFDSAADAYNGKLLLWMIGTGDPDVDVERAHELVVAHKPAGVLFEMEAPYKGNPSGTTEERARYAAARTLAVKWERLHSGLPRAAITPARERFFDYLGVLTAGFRIFPESYIGNGATPVAPVECVESIRDLVDRFYVHPVISCVPSPLSARVRELLRAQTIGCAVYTIDALAQWAHDRPAEWTALPAGPPVVAHRTL